MRVACFDLEGPLSPQDNAYESLGLVEDGHKVFEVISRYDDLLVLEGHEDYEAGDTLALIVPFLAHGRITLQKIKQVSRTAGLVSGAMDLIRALRATGFEVFIISTSYDPHALAMGRRLSVTKDHVHSTLLDPSLLETTLTQREESLISRSKEVIVRELYSNDLERGTKDAEIKRHLDQFYWQDLPTTRFGVIINKIAVRGGRRKAWALEQISRRKKVSLRDLLFVGDSITDVRACQLVEVMGGLAIAFNGNQFILPHATVGVASDSLMDILPVVEAWGQHGRFGAKEWVNKRGKPTRDVYSWLPGVGTEALRLVAEQHARSRRHVRADAAKLG